MRTVPDKRVSGIGVVILAGALAISLTGCAPGGGSVTQSITGTWKLIYATDSKGTFRLDGAHVTLKVDGASSGGQGPCNAYGATLSRSTIGPITVKRGITTTIACVPNSRNVLESRYFAELGSVNYARFAAGDLYLVGNDGTLKFAPAGS